MESSAGFLDVFFGYLSAVRLIFLSKKSEAEVLLMLLKDILSLFVLRILSEFFKRLNGDDALSDSLFVLGNNVVKARKSLIERTSGEDTGDPGDGNFKSVFLLFRICPGEGGAIGAGAGSVCQMPSMEASLAG